MWISRQMKDAIVDSRLASKLCWAVFAVAFAAATTSPLCAQLRVVTYNTHGNPTSPSELDDWSVVLQAIGDQDVGGIAKPIGIMALQEINPSGNNAQNIANLLNNLYGVSSYSAATAPYGDGYNSQSFVYDSSQVELLDTLAFGMGVRPGWRGHFRPVDYDDSAAEFYLYSVHLKAYPEYEAERASEAAQLRQNGDRLAANANLIYAGDFNLTEGGAEAAYATMLAAGNGQALDPEDGDFTDPVKKSYSSSSPTSRLDFQFVSTEMDDQQGLDLIDGSYHVFGRQYIPGTSRIETSPPEVTSTSDHLAVVADYQLPAVMGAVLGEVPETLNVGKAFELDVTISNLASVVAAAGADELDYTMTVSGDLFGSAAGTVTALSDGDLQHVTLDTSTPGLKSGTVILHSTSRAVQNPSLLLPVSFEVLGGLPGDYNGDGTVDGADYTVWRDTLHQSGDGLAADGNGDGTVDGDDYLVWKTHFGQSAGSGLGASPPAAVPEPAGLVLTLVATMATFFAVRPVAGGEARSPGHHSR
jgi:endonuclease/exonuclease/phosphatase family metal-dependent hydrolase